MKNRILKRLEGFKVEVSKPVDLYTRVAPRVEAGNSFPYRVAEVRLVPRKLLQYNVLCFSFRFEPFRRVSTSFCLVDGKLDGKEGCGNEMRSH